MSDQALASRDDRPLVVVLALLRADAPETIMGAPEDPDHPDVTTIRGNLARLIPDSG
jgi:hypothetical protein